MATSTKVPNVVSELYEDDRGTMFRQVTRGDDVLVQIEYYHDINFIEPHQIKRKAGVSVQDIKPDAYERFLKRMGSFQAEYTHWQTVVVDSVTTMEISARRWDQFVLNPSAEDGRQWYGASKDFLERMLLGRFGALPMNVVVLAHIDDEKFEHHGTQRRMPMAPGKLRGSLPSQYGEVYHAYVDKDGEHYLQTHTDALWTCTSAIGAPNPSTPHYAALWPDAHRQPIHVLTYGDFGAGKSTFAATFPKPMLVFAFDAHGKDTPYLRGGRTS